MFQRDVDNAASPQTDDVILNCLSTLKNSPLKIERLGKKTYFKIISR
jgi:hypothetical protein